MHSSIEMFSDLIDSYTVIVDQIMDNGEHVFKAKLKLKNNTKLDVYERLKTLDRNYSYNWRRWNNTLIIRWDNAKHHRELDSYPHHKHIENDQNVETSEEMTLDKVIKYILQTITFLFIIFSIVYLFYSYS